MTTAMVLFHGPVVQALTQALGWTLLHFLWQGTLIAVVLWCALALMERRSPDARYAAASLALLGMVVLPLLTFAHLAGEEYSATLAHPIVIDASSITVHAGAAGARSWSDYLTTPAIDRMMPSLMLVWCIGVLIFSCRLALGIAVAQGWKLQGVQDAPAQLQSLFDRLRTRLGVKRAAQLVESAKVHVPMVIGWLKPVVLLPAGCLAGLSPQQVEALLAHELAHICRNDYLVSVVQSVLEAVLFYHPAVWWVSKQVRREREYCCDEMAVAVCGDRLAYARALSQLEERRALLPELALGANGGALTMRIKRLLGYREDIASSNMVWVIALVIVIAGGGSIIGRYALAESKPALSAGASVERASQEAQDIAKTAVAENDRNPAQAERQIERAAERSQAAQEQLAQAQEQLAQATNNASAHAADHKQLNDAQLKQLADAQKQVQAALERLNSAEFKEQMRAAQEQIKKLNSPEFRKQMEAASAAAVARLNSPEFRKQLEDAQKRLQNSQEMQQKIQAWMNSPQFKMQFRPEFKMQFEDAQKQAEKFNTPEFRKKIEDAQRQAQSEIQKFNSPEFKKQLEEAQKQAEKFNTPEFRKRLEDMQKHVQEETQKFNSPEYREKLRKMLEDARKNGAQFKSSPNAFIAQNPEPPGPSQAPAPPPPPPPPPPPADAAPAPNGPVRVSGAVASGQLVKSVPPVYPQIARAAHVEGTVTLHAVISNTGTVERLQVLSGPPMLVPSAMDAVRQWIYKPYLLNGQPTEVETTINVNFSLDNAAPAPSPTPESNAGPSPSPQSSLTPTPSNRSMPRVIYKVNPEYTAEARAAKVQGPVVLNVLVNDEGLPENVHVVRSLDLGLDQKAIEAVNQYRFMPAIREGHPIAVPVNVEVQFRLF
ncbi:MAG TPA: TonB family protein [Acidobacteriaceae bacterium]|nr:TonB family protein [Acidobacteriaceae bacterium]